MKVDKKILSIFLILLITSVFAIAPVSAKKPSSDGVQGLQVSITGTDLVDLEGGGEENDVLLHGKVDVLTGQSGTYQVTLTLSLKYLGTDPENPIEKKTKFDTTLRKTISVYCQGGSWSESDFTFEIYNKLGWYRATVTAKYGRISAESDPFEFDPPGGSRGPIHR